MVQWYSLAALAVVLWLALNWRRAWTIGWRRYLTRRAAAASLLLLALVCAAPVVASYVAYYWFRPEATRQLRRTAARPGPRPRSTATTLDGAALPLTELRGQWVLLSIEARPATMRCAAQAATRRARRARSRAASRTASSASGCKRRVRRSPRPNCSRSTRGSSSRAATSRAWAALPGGGAQRIYLIDPLGNLVLRYPDDPDIKGLAKDLKRLLEASRIG